MSWLPDTLDYLVSLHYRLVTAQLAHTQIVVGSRMALAGKCCFAVRNL